MINSTYYSSPIGEILLVSKDNNLIGAWFEGQKHFLSTINEELMENEDEILFKAKSWLSRYFSGEKPNINELYLKPEGTDFRCDVWHILCEIPYGETVTYKEIADKIAQKRGIDKVSAQAVGGAVGHNPISIIIPCHRVVGSDGSLTGYAGGLDKKIFLLKHENPEF